ncbi:FAR1 [[Candida] subhashii]|uniref:FAR1 n=1 Tax=[Candida] subhashii TaxID=561895 RepID=A0A8J5UYJ3_9ASCO|nr:FAR1 [[Candida] subhashii]KAG7664385.1 FAR1 [[Candida] subhashii]
MVKLARKFLLHHPSPRKSTLDPNLSKKGSPLVNEIALSTDWEAPFSGSSSKLKPDTQTQLPPLKENQLFETRSYVEDNCAFCQVLLSASLPGESNVLLSCDHLCHEQCLTVMMDKTGIIENLKCGICDQDTKCQDENVVKDLMKKWKEGSGQEYLKENSLLDLKVTPTFGPMAESESMLQEIPEIEKNHKNMTVYFPNIECACQADKTLDQGDITNFNCVFTIKSPEVYKKSPNTRDETELKEKIVSHIRTKFKLAFENLGDLLMFDKVEVSVTGREWDEATAYLFNQYFLLYDEETLVGVVSLEDDLTTVNAEDRMLTLNLTKETLPELSVRFPSTVISVKWDSAINSLKNKSNKVNYSLFEFSGTFWKEFQDKFDIPEDLIKFTDLVVNDNEIPEEYLAKALPCPEDLPLNLIVAIPLVNRTGLSDQEYQDNVVCMIEMVLEVLRPKDKLGVIWIGINGQGEASKKGAFTGCIESSWDGWREMIQNISVVANSFRNNLEELKIAFQKCSELYPFIDVDNNSIKKFIIISGNDYLSDRNTVADKNLIKLVNDMKSKISVTLIRIGKVTNKPIDILHRLLSKDMSFGNHLLIFNSFREMIIDGGPLIQNHFQKICIPELSIEMELDQPHVSLNVEESGFLAEKEGSNKICIRLKDLIPNSERTVSVALTHNKKNLSHWVSKNLFKYQATWFNGEIPSQTIHEKDIVSETNPSISSRCQDGKSRSNQSLSVQNSDVMLDIPLLASLNE